jgi:tetratricopeptide (TPR) repeat protein
VGQLWQVPVFLLGTVTLTAFLLARPNWNNPLRRSEARLNQARRLWDHNDSHPRKIIELVEYYLEHAGPEPQRAAEAHFLWGSTLVRSARQLNGEEALPLWKEAYQHLIQARDLGLSESDLPRMRVALGEAGFYTDDDLKMVIQRMTRNLEAADDRTIVCRLLTLACLKKQPPDLGGALHANEMLRQHPLLSEDVLAPARLQGGEILLRLRRPGEARKLLEKIARDAPADLLAQALTLRARSHQDESQWAEAAALWQEVLEDKRHPPTDPGEVLYCLGLSQRRQEQRNEAAASWKESVKQGGLDASSAASLGLAELQLAEGDPAALDSLTRAVRTTRSAADWKNPHVDLRQVRAQFEQGCLVFLRKHDYEKALSVAQAYERIAIPGMAALVRGQALRDWGERLAQGSESERRQSAELLRQAGLAFEAAAQGTTEPRERAERLWLAANAHQDGQDPGRTVQVLQQFLSAPGQSPERSGEAWYLLARAYEQLKKETEADAAYRRCMDHRGRFAFRARERLSELKLEHGYKDQAVDLLELNIRLMRDNVDDEALERSLYGLGHLLYERNRDYENVRQVLENAVTRYPSSTSAIRGRYELAETYMQLASQESQKIVNGSDLPADTREHFLKQRRMWLSKAAEQYQLLSEALADPKAVALLTQAEQAHVHFSVADCRFNLGEYAEALKLYDDLADRFKGRLERLSALGGTARCYAAQRDFPRFKARLDDIRVSLRDVDAQTRHEWEQWLSIAGKGQ